MPQFNYGPTQPQWTVGQIATNHKQDVDSYTNEMLPQISVVTVGGTATAGNYVITATGPDGEQVSATFTRVAETNDGISDGLLAAINTDDDWANVAVATDSGVDELTLTFVQTGRAYSFTLSAPAPGTLAVANSQEAGGIDIPLGVAVRDGSADDLATILGAGTVDADLLGIHVRGIDALVNELGADNNVVGPGKTLSVLSKGVAAVLVEDAVTKGANAFCRIANPAAGDPVGLFRSDADGGDAIQMLSAKFDSSTTGRGIALVRVNRP